jgi:PhnB protein
MAKAIPEGLRTLTPSLAVDGAAEAIEFYKKAFGAEEVSRAMDPSGKKVWHAHLRIRDSAFFINDVAPEMGNTATSSAMWIYTEGVDAAFDRAIKAGGKATMPVADMFWGDRTGSLVDRWGIRWSIAQHMKDLTPAEMEAAQEAFIADMGKMQKK